MTEKPAVQSVARSFALLEKLAAYPSGAPIKQLAEDMALPKSTLHRLLANLIDLGYAAQTGDNGHYRATLKMYELGSSIVRQHDIVSAARPFLSELAEEMGETVHLVIQDGCEVVYVFKAESGDRGMSSRLGSRMPLYSTGVGKAILSTLPHKTVRQIWDASGIRTITPNTITSFAEMEKELAAAKRRGWAYDNEENEMGICCVAVALPAASGPPAAFSVACLKPAITEERLQLLSKKCLAVRQKILEEIGLVW